MRSSMDEARRRATENCLHPPEYIRLGIDPEVTGRWVPDDIDPDGVYCLRCERQIGFSI